MSQIEPNNRLYFLDNLRTFMVFPMVVLHSGLVYETFGFAGFFWIVYDFSGNSLVDELKWSNSPGKGISPFSAG